MKSCVDALARLCDPGAEVSAHYLIGSDGTVYGLVSEEARAWHAGAGEWAGADDVNSRSIGIELDNDGHGPFAEAQMVALEALLRDVMDRLKIAASGVIGHSDVAPGRKVDPGPFFDWPRLERQGLAGRRGYDQGPTDVRFETFRTLARNAGYTAPVDNETLLAAVRLRYRPDAKGPLTPEDYTPLGHAALWT